MPKAYIAHRRILTVALFAMATLALNANAADWPRFRGPTGQGVAAKDAKPPLKWSGTENLKWKLTLPGPGSSSPIVIGDKVFITSYSGYGASRSDVGDMSDLKRHLVCVNRNTGKVIWSKAADANPEDSYRGYISEHGYATSTPVSDREHVFVFYGKTGVLAYDMNGELKWKTNVGRESGSKRWGSAASPILYKDMVIVNASEENEAIIALDKATGKQRWKAQASSLDLSYGTPMVVDAGDRKDLVLTVPEEVWGLNPDTGKLRWYAGIPMDGNISPSVIAADGVVYTIGGYRTNGSAAIKVGGKGDVTQSHTVWKARATSYVPSPVLADGKLYWVSDRGEAICVDAKTGREIFSESLGTRGRGKPFYASVVLADGKLYATSRTAGTYVIAAKPSFKLLAHNVIEGDNSQFNGSPTVVGKQIILRSDRALYCFEAK